MLFKTQHILYMLILDKSYIKAIFLFLSYRDGKEIKPTSNTRLTQDGPICMLKTSKFTKSEIGTYKCIATNIVGSAECEAKVDGKFYMILI